jgi:hypothetical protein
LFQILKTEADDLHCDYNKFMNKYNYNILIIFISSQSYTLENTKLADFIQLIDVLNKLERSGEVLYDDITKYLKQYYANIQGNILHNNK